MAFGGRARPKPGLSYVRAAALWLNGISGYQLTVKTGFIHTEETSRRYWDRTAVARTLALLKSSQCKRKPKECFVRLNLE